MNRELIAKTEAFLKETYRSSPRMQAHPAQEIYRLEHSYRVANIAKAIAEAEGFPATYAVMAGLLHDLAYCEEMPSPEDWKNHGRRGAVLARPFLESLELPAQVVNDICYSIAIHVDDKADFEWERSHFTEIAGDADNIDRFDAYRVYETLEYIGYSRFSTEEKRAYTEMAIERLTKYLQMELATPAATELWQWKINHYMDFFRRLLGQLDAGTGYLQTERRRVESPVDPERMMQLSGHF